MKLQNKSNLKVGITEIRSGFRSGGEVYEGRRGFSQSDRQGMDAQYCTAGTHSACVCLCVCGIPWAADKSVSHAGESAALGDTMATDPSRVSSTSSSDHRRPRCGRWNVNVSVPPVCVMCLLSEQALLIKSTNTTAQKILQLHSVHLNELINEL